MPNEKVESRELVAGSMGGAVAAVIEYPFDTIKVRMQNDTKRYGNGWQCVKNVIKEEGIANGLFKGLPAPVAGYAIESAVFFYAYRYGMMIFQRFAYSEPFEHDREPYAAVAASGGFCGLVVSQVLTPAELIKCKMQVQNTLPAEERIYKSSWACAKSVYQQNGLVGLYRGHVAMLLREFIGCAIFFVALHFVIRSLIREDQKVSEASPFVHFLGGGCAGLSFWTSIYAIDVIKTKQQTMRLDYRNLNFRQSFARVYRREGLRGFYRGYPVTIVRAFPGNAALIAVYEKVIYAWDAIPNRIRERSSGV